MSDGLNLFESYIEGSRSSIYILIRAKNEHVVESKILEYYDQNIQEFGELLNYSVTASRYMEQRNVPYIIL